MASHAVKVSSDLVEGARESARWADRSVTGQIEHWAKLGRAVETSLSEPAARALKRSGGDLNTAFDTSEERAQVMDVLARLRESMPFASTAKSISAKNPVRYEADSENPEGIIQINPDGTRVPGHFAGRTFIAADSL